jgi:hypothetical protein
MENPMLKQFPELDQAQEEIDLAIDLVNAAQDRRLAAWQRELAEEAMARLNTAANLISLIWTPMEMTR